MNGLYNPDAWKTVHIKVDILCSLKFPKLSLNLKRRYFRLVTVSFSSYQESYRTLLCCNNPTRLFVLKPLSCITQELIYKLIKIFFRVRNVYHFHFILLLNENDTRFILK